jgi:type I restriction enzyme S subunit
MPSEWWEMTLGDFVSLQRGHDLPEQNRKPGPIPIVGSFGVTGYHNEARTKGPGITVGRSGASFGVVCYSPVDFWPLNTALYVTDFHGNDVRFAYYFLKQFDFNRYNSGSAQASLNRNYIHPIKVRVPPLCEQQAIAGILGALDDKIELNRKMNKTLEQMAQATFKSWFVDFEPFRDKGMVDSELGELPKGWRVGTLGEVAANPRRPVGPAEIRPGTPYIALEHMPRKSICLADWDTGDEVESGKSAFRKEEVLFGKLRPYFHKVGVAPLDGVCSTDILVVAPKSPHWLGYVLGHVSSDSFVAYTNAGSEGTKMPRTNWTRMAVYSLAVPTDSAAGAFNAVVAPALECITQNVWQSRTLAAIRDALLPKLMSGEVLPKQMESVVNGVQR